MIQRIQSVYLLLTTLLSLLFLKGEILGFFNETGEIINLTFSGIVRTGENGTGLIHNSFLASALIIATALLSLATIFLYKKRNIQMMLAGLLTGCVIAFILACGYYYWLIVSEYNGELVPGIKMILPVIMLILAILAYRGIKKDDKLVKSYDRLR